MLGYKAKGIKAADWVEAVSQITLIKQARECQLDYATGGPNVITGSLKVEKGDRWVGQSDTVRD